jgi:AcrR family transcriptional regulator
MPATSSKVRNRTASASPTLQERKQQVVRSAIWDAATDLFAEKGYDETTVDEIAERAGISRRSFFRYFSSKGDLMASGIVDYGASIGEAIRGCPRGIPVAEVVRHAILQVARQGTAMSRTRKVMQILAKYPAAKEALSSREAELRKCVEAAFASRGGPFRDLEPALLADLTLAILDVVFHFWFRQGEQDIEAAVDQVWRALGRMVGA